MDEARIAVIGNAAAMAAAYFMEEFLDEDSEDEDFVWEKVTVNVDEYLLFGDPTFRRHFRLCKTLFEILCQELAEAMVLSGSLVREGRDFRHKVLMVLWILATPDTFRSVALRFGVHPGEVHRYYKKIIVTLAEMGARYISWPDARERVRIKRTLKRISGFPDVVGMIDGKHIEITQPLEEPAAYRNRHHSYSILVQAVCDDHLMVRDLYVGEAGSLHDARVFRRSPLCRNMLFQPELFSEGEHIIGDSAYLLTDRLLVPFVNNGHLTDLQKEYNRSLSRIRVKIEHTFGKYTSLWRRNKFLPVKKMEYAVDHVCATFVLHNFKIHHGELLRIVNVAEAELPEAAPVAGMREIHDDEDVEFDVEDQYAIDGNGAILLRDAQLRGVQKRWDICNNFAHAHDDEDEDEDHDSEEE